MASAPTPLEEYPQIRQWIYRAFWVVGLVLGAVQIWTATAGGDIPDWLLPALAVLGYVSVATNYTADRNVTIPKEEAVKLSAVQNTNAADVTVLGTTQTPVATQAHLDTPPDDERGPANYDERGVYDNYGLLIAIAAIVVIVCGVVWLLGR